jgi:Fe-S-cluster containining protein
MVSRPPESPEEDRRADAIDPCRLSDSGEEIVLHGVNLSRDFVCHSCGACCRGEGEVFVTRQRAVLIAEHLGVELSEFRRRYTRRDVEGGHLLRDRSLEDDACIFLDDANRCMIHAVKPEQCANFPFRWRNSNFTSTCEGFMALKRPDETR